jgi:hypothetical protein
MISALGQSLKRRFGWGWACALLTLLCAPLTFGMDPGSPVLACSISLAKDNMEPNFYWRQGSQLFALTYENYTLFWKPVSEPRIVPAKGTRTKKANFQILSVEESEHGAPKIFFQETREVTDLKMPGAEGLRNVRGVPIGRELFFTAYRGSSLVNFIYDTYEAKWRTPEQVEIFLADGGGRISLARVESSTIGRFFGLTADGRAFHAKPCPLYVPGQNYVHFDLYPLRAPGGGPLHNVRAMISKEYYVFFVTNDGEIFFAEMGNDDAPLKPGFPASLKMPEGGVLEIH